MQSQLLACLKSYGCNNYWLYERSHLTLMVVMLKGNRLDYDVALITLTRLCLQMVSPFLQAFHLLFEFAWKRFQ